MEYALKQAVCEPAWLLGMTIVACALDCKQVDTRLMLLPLVGEAGKFVVPLTHIEIHRAGQGGGYGPEVILICQ